MRRLGVVVAAVAILATGCTVAVGGAAVRGTVPASTTSSSEAPEPTTTEPAEEPDTSGPAEPPITLIPDPGETDTPIDPAAEQPGPVAPPEEGSSDPPDEAVGMAPDAPDPQITIRGGTDGPVDQIATAALADLFAFYTEIFPGTFGQTYEPPKRLVSYDSRTRHKEICGIDVHEFANAFYIADCDTVAWDRAVLLAQLQDSVGALAPAVVLSHEIGHDVQFQTGMPWDAPTLVLEQQADCYAGAYWRWVYEGHSAYFVFNQTEGMRQMLSSLLAVKDPPMTPSDVELYGTEDNHGNGFDRTYAATLGYTQGALRCSGIDAAEVDARLQEFPFDNDTPYQYGNLDITPEVIEDILAVADDYFTRAQPGYTTPNLVRYQGRRGPDCAGEPAPFPVAYCAADRTVSYQLEELQRIGTPTKGWDSPNGDFSAFVLLVTRYALAAQDAGHAPITGTPAGLLSLCYTGTWATWLRLPRGGYQLSPNDLDKAIYEIMASPVAGSDANGVTGAPLIERVQAFGFGVTHSMPECFDAYLP